MTKSKDKALEIISEKSYFDGEMIKRTKTLLDLIDNGKG